MSTPPEMMIPRSRYAYNTQYERALLLLTFNFKVYMPLKGLNLQKECASYWHINRVSTVS
jgi:hypothetical protein